MACREVDRCGNHWQRAVAVGYVDDATAGMELLIADDVLDRVDR